MAKTRKRKSLSVRLQPYEGTALAEVVDYLNSLDKEEAHKKVADVLLMCLLPYARNESHHAYTSYQLRLTCLESCDCMDKHASFMRQALMVEQPKFKREYITIPADDYNADDSDLPLEDDAEDMPERVPNTFIKGQGSTEDVDMLFGD